MTKCVIYSLTIYLLIMMSIIMQKPALLCDQKGDFKSWNYLKYKLLNRDIQNYHDLICYPTIMFICCVFSFLMAKNLNK